MICNEKYYIWFKKKNNIWFAKKCSDPRGPLTKAWNTMEILQIFCCILRAVFKTVWGPWTYIYGEVHFAPQNWWFPKNYNRPSYVHGVCIGWAHSSREGYVKLSYYWHQINVQDLIYLKTWNISEFIGIHLKYGEV